MWKIIDMQYVVRKSKLTTEAIVQERCLARTWFFFFFLKWLPLSTNSAGRLNSPEGKRLPVC